MANHIIYNALRNDISRNAAILAARDLANLLGIPTRPPLVLDFTNTLGRDKLVIEVTISRPFTRVFRQRNENFAAGAANQSINVTVNAQHPASINILREILSSSQSQTFEFTFKLEPLKSLSYGGKLIANLGLVDGKICLMIIKNAPGSTTWPTTPQAGAQAMAAPEGGQTIASGGVKLP